MTKRLSWFEENLRTTSNALRAEWREDSTNECFNTFLIKRLIKFKARDAKLHEFMKRQAEDCLVMAKHDDSINARNEADIWLKALLLV